jgi:hypothetical protein
MVVNPDTVNYFYSSVLYLYEKGFRYIIISLNYEAHWTEKNMKELKKQYEGLAEFYMDITMKEDKFYLSPFEVKISSYINGDNYCNERCNHYCECMNKQATGSINKVSPVQCSHERLLIPIADKLAERLYKKRNALFIQKHYNEIFPMLLMIEDKTAVK